MIKGVSKKEEDVIRLILKPYSNRHNFFYYGSRVKGNFNKTSDLDILIKGEGEFSLDDIETIKESFDKSELPFIVNLVDYKSIDEVFYNSIKENLTEIFH